MSTSKHFDKICIIVLIITLAVTVLFMNGERLGMQVIINEDAESYEGSEYFTKNDLNGDWDYAELTTITLNGDSAKIKGSGAYFNDGNVYIIQSGFYEFTGTLTDGSIIVDAKNYSKVWIRLAGVDITCSDDACLRIEEADKTFLTLAEGTENTLTSGEEYSEEALADGTGGTIYAHDDLTINGSGSLTITAPYKHGIEVNDALRITGGMIAITAAQDGINANDECNITGATINITAGDDGIHCDEDIYILDGTITIRTGDEGIAGANVENVAGEITVILTDTE